MIDGRVPALTKALILSDDVPSSLTLLNRRLGHLASQPTGLRGPYPCTSASTCASYVSGVTSENYAHVASSVLASELTRAFARGNT